MASGGTPPRFVPWREIRAVEVERRRVVLVLHDGAPMRLVDAYQGVGAVDLAGRLTDLRRRGLLGALRPARPKRR